MNNQGIATAIQQRISEMARVTRPLRNRDRLIEDLGLESIQLIELVSFVEDVSGKILDNRALEEIRRVGDVTALVA